MNQYMFDSYLVRKKLETTLPKVFSEENITFEQYLLLDLLQQAGKLSSTAIAKEIGISKPAISRRCRDLNRRGLIERQVPSDLNADLRLVEYTLSDEGKNCLTRLNQGSAAVLSALKHTKDWEEYQAALEKVLTYLNKAQEMAVGS